MGIRRIWWYLLKSVSLFDNTKDEIRGFLNTSRGVDSSSLRGEVTTEITDESMLILSTLLAWIPRVTEFIDICLRRKITSSDRAVGSVINLASVSRSSPVVFLVNTRIYGRMDQKNGPIWTPYFYNSEVSGMPAGNGRKSSSLRSFLRCATNLEKWNTNYLSLSAVNVSGISSASYASSFSRFFSSEATFIGPLIESKARRISAVDRS